MITHSANDILNSLTPCDSESMAILAVKETAVVMYRTFQNNMLYCQGVVL